MVVPVLDPTAAERVLDGLDGLLLTGGDDVDSSWYGEGDDLDATGPSMSRDAFEIFLVRGAVERRRPILGICRGHQVLNVALGGTLVPEGPSSEEIDLRSTGDSDPISPRIHVASGSLLAAVLDRTDFAVEGAGHRPVRFTGAGLQVVATSAAGDVAAVEGLGDLRALGIHWHPERVLHEPGNAELFGWLVREASSTPSGQVPVVGPGVVEGFVAVPAAIV